MKSLLNFRCGILEQMPDSIALRTWEGDLAFSMLEERSIRLAARLHRFWGANALIALPFQFDYLIALHACMRSQVAAFPIDIST
jgi:hypothetical protein